MASALVSRRRQERCTAPTPRADSGPALGHSCAKGRGRSKTGRAGSQTLLPSRGQGLAMGQTLAKCSSGWVGISGAPRAWPAGPSRRRLQMPLPDNCHERTRQPPLVPPAGLDSLFIWIRGRHRPECHVRWTPRTRGVPVPTAPRAERPGEQTARSNLPNSPRDSVQAGANDISDGIPKARDPRRHSPLDGSRGLSAPPRPRARRVSQSPCTLSRGIPTSRVGLLRSSICACGTPTRSHGPMAGSSVAAADDLLN